MSIFKVIALVVIASVAKCDYSDKNDDEFFDIDKYYGTWYDVAVMFYTKIDPNPILCQSSEVMPQGGDNGGFKEILTILHKNGISGHYEGIGEVDGRHIYITYGSDDESTLVYGVMSYNNGDEMILHDKKNAMSSVLVSRNSSLQMITREAKEDFEALAAQIGGIVHYVENENCE